MTRSPSSSRGREREARVVSSEPVPFGSPSQSGFWRSMIIPWFGGALPH